MNERIAKKIRKEARLKASAVYADARDYKRVINAMPLPERVKIAIKILRGRF